MITLSFHSMTDVSWNLNVNFLLLVVFLKFDTEVNLVGLNESLHYLSVMRSWVWGNRNLLFQCSYSVTQWFKPTILLSCFCTTWRCLSKCRIKCLWNLWFSKYNPVSLQNRSEQILWIHSIVCDCDSDFVFHTNIWIKVQDSLLSDVCFCNSDVK